MERHKCKLCLKSFSNGRALGGHMRSHMLNLPIPPNPEPPPNQLSEEAESASISSSSSSEDEVEEEPEGGGGEEDEEKGQCYGLRENPKRSIRLVDPEFSFAVDTGSVVLQDRESETESSKNPTRRRSKRTRKSGLFDHNQYHQQQQQQQRQEQENVKNLKSSKLSKSESWAEPEPVSSISDTTTEEDVAFCLMMLSRDKWKKKAEQELGIEQEHENEDDEEDEEAEKSLEETDDSDELKFCKTRNRGKYKCETCKKVFKSYQALGGHRASHKKIKINAQAQIPELETQNAGTCSSMADKKIHECPVCFRVFSSGQALGGHKRSHVTNLPATPAKSRNKFGDNLIDLNLPAPVEDDDTSQIELSAVSDAEFVNHIKR